jgi:hypothetical protein
VDLNFKSDWKHVSVPVPKWDPGAAAVLKRWATEMLACGLYTKSKSPSASRPHIVRKPPPDAPKDVDIKECGLRVCGDYRRPNDQLQKSFPSTANGTDELAKLPGYKYYWITDRFSMHNAYALRPGPCRELLAVHTPVGLIEPTRMVFVEMVPPTNLPELRSTLGVFVQSARFIPRYSHIVAPLTALTRSSQGKPVPFLWADEQQTAYDHVRTYSSMASISPRRTIAYRSMDVAMPPTTANLSA